MPGKIGSMKAIFQRNKKHSGVVFFFHGAGNTGEGALYKIRSLIGDFSLPHVKFLFPTAPLKPYTLNKGLLTNVWFDYFSMDQGAPDHQESIVAIGNDVRTLIQKEVNMGIPLERIIVGGFSMGGTLALHTAYRFSPGLGGCFALSAFINDGSLLYEALTEQPSSTPLLMCHGDNDPLVLYKWGRATFNNFLTLKVKSEFVTLKGVAHDMDKNEMLRVISWISSILPNK